MNQGSAKAKTIDPITGPLVRKAFELYGTGRHSLETLRAELHRLGLRTGNDGKVTRTSLSKLLNNPFYFGIIRIKSTGETFPAIHEPLIGKALFDRVKAVLSGKVCIRSQRHTFQFRRMVCCAICRHSLIGERQKGHVYYRCHGKPCRTSIREETVESGVEQLLKTLCFNDEERRYFKARIQELRATWQTQKEDEIRSLSLRLGQIKDRLNRLTDAYLDHVLDKTMFEERKKCLLLDQKAAEEQIVNLSHENRPVPDKLEKFLELAGNAWLSHQLASPEEKREMVKILTSNRVVQGKHLELTPSFPFQDIANRCSYLDCAPERDIPRTWDRILAVLTAASTRGELPDLSTVFGCREDDSESPAKTKGARLGRNGKIC